MLSKGVKSMSGKTHTEEVYSDRFRWGVVCSVTDADAGVACNGSVLGTVGKATADGSDFAKTV
jgi:hypothetical protein